VLVRVSHKVPLGARCNSNFSHLLLLVLVSGVGRVRLRGEHQVRGWTVGLLRSHRGRHVPGQGPANSRQAIASVPDPTGIPHALVNLKTGVSVLSKCSFCLYHRRRRFSDVQLVSHL
jgi:hypothetical protein